MTCIRVPETADFLVSSGGYEAEHPCGVRQIPLLVWHAHSVHSGAEWGETRSKREENTMKPIIHTVLAFTATWLALFTTARRRFRVAAVGVAVIAAAAFLPTLPAGSPLTTGLCASEDDGPLCPKLCPRGLYPCANAVVDGHKVTCLGPAPEVDPPKK